MISKTLYVVHCIDTEGPLNETLNASFERLNKSFGLKIRPSIKMLKDLQQSKIDHQGIEKAVADLLNPKILKKNKNWEEIKKMLSEALSDKFRNIYLDDFNNGWIYSWHCMDHVNMKSNPRSKAVGYGKIFDFYSKILKKKKIKQDEINWHFHPQSIQKQPLQAATSFNNSMESLLYIMCRRVIDHQWFPICNRPGFHSERPDSHSFLEQWIPFDYANQFNKSVNSQPDLNLGRFGDWRRSSSTWRGYHPSHTDYQVSGNCNRRIFRCLNVGTRFNELEESHVVEAFVEAQSKGKAILAFSNHDYRDIRPGVLKVKKMLKKIKKRFLDIKIKYSGAENAARKILIQENGTIKKPNIEIFIKENRLIAKSIGGKLFGPQPFLSIKTKTNHYYHDNFDFQKPCKEWSYTFDDQTINLNKVKSIGVASAGMQGHKTVQLINF